MVQVIGIGYGRTGTESLQHALNRLGYQTFHAPTTWVWERVLLQTWYRNTTKYITNDNYCPVDFGKFLEGYTAATGFLWAVCWEDLLEKYPDAYFILTRQESSEEWLVSWQKYLKSIALLPRYIPNLPLVKEMDFYHRWLLSYLHDKDKSFFNRKIPLDQLHPNAQLLQESYQQHLARIRATVPSYQLLELPLPSLLEDGINQDQFLWDQLTGFLNVSIPPGFPYPHVGTSESVQWQCRTVVMGGNLLLLIVLALSTHVVTKLWKWIFSSQKPPQKEEPSVGKENINHQETMQLDDQAQEEDFIPTVKIMEESEKDAKEYAYLLSISQMQQLAEKALPPAVALRRWKRLYRLSRDGDDFSTFLQLTSGHPQTLLVIQTTRQQLLGAFVDSPWDTSERENYNILSHAASGFYGSTQACLFSFAMGDGKNEASSSKSNDKDDDTNNSDDEPSVAVYKWSGLNRYIQLLDVRRGRLALGGSSNGASHHTGFGLCIEDNFSKGTTSACDTYNTPGPLTGNDTEMFAVLDVEVWAFPSGTLA